jgi:hypothetical protein
LSYETILLLKSDAKIMKTFIPTRDPAKFIAKKGKTGAQASD